MQNDMISRSAAKDEILSWAVCLNKPHLLSRDDTMCVLDTLPAVDAVERKKLIKKLFPMGVPNTREEWNYSINAKAVYEAIMKTEG